ncbi:MAG: hypothetical protein NW226_07455 [Microscillaceae bacterium]|nr:hypothetical protein [Microscillaceae bacterium]
MEKIIVPTYHPSEALFRELSPEQKFTRILELLYALNEDTLPPNFLRFSSEEIAFFIENYPNVYLSVLDYFKDLWLEKENQERLFQETFDDFKIFMKSFNKWNFEQVEQHFGLTRISNHPELVKWQNMDVLVSEEEQKRLDWMKSFLIQHIDTWREEDLKMSFISPMLLLVDFNTESSRPFFEMEMSGTLHSLKEGEISVSGKVDCMISYGKIEPQAPIFCLHEYKPELTSSKNPLGQLLIAMLITQQENQSDHVLYGVYIAGRHWYFITLWQNQYSVSLAYDATKSQEITDIFKMLKGLKEHVILKKINNPA